jgi:hypothetical protein
MKNIRRTLTGGYSATFPMTGWKRIRNGIKSGDRLRVYLS